jgi:predicted O-methyltransferase YrrM
MGAQAVTKWEGTPSQRSTTVEQIAKLRRLQEELSGKPITGSMLALRRPLYKILRSAFTRQHLVNAATIDLIEAVCKEQEHAATGVQRQIAAAMKSSAAAPGELRVFEPVRCTDDEVESSMGELQDQGKLNNVRPLTGFNAVYTAPAELRMTERVALYSLVFGLQPRNCLEIGTFRGGSAAIICGAMDDTGFGQLACIDPSPKVDSQLWDSLRHRCRMYAGMSPDILAQVAAESGGPFEFIWVDGSHYYENVLNDIVGLIPHLADQAYLLFHDAHSSGVKQAIDEAVASRAQLIDCGLLSVEPTILDFGSSKEMWAGMRLLRFER